MRSVKPAFGLFGALIPVLYCGGLLYYFFGFQGATDGPLATGLGPTILGLGAVGLLFCIPLLLKVIRLFAPAPGGNPVPSEPEEVVSDFDPDAALARYMARRAAEGIAPPPLPTSEVSAPVQRPSFGRKIG